MFLIFIKMMSKGKKRLDFLFVKFQFSFELLGHIVRLICRLTYKDCRGMFDH